MWLAALVVVLAIVLLLYLDTVKPKNFPPGPRWLPVIGCAHTVYKLREKIGYLYKVVEELSKQCPDESILGIKIGKDKIVLVNSLEGIKEMLYNENIDGRPKGIFYQTRTWGKRRGVLLTDGELWKEQRRFLIKHLREFGFGRTGMGNIAVSEGAHMIDDVLQIIKDSGNNSVTIHMHNFFNVYILNTLWTMMAGLRYNATDPEMIILQGLLFDLFAAVDMVGTVFSHFPILSIIAPTRSGYKEFLKTHKRIWKFLREEWERHKENFEPEKEDKDFMDVYIRALSDHGPVNTYSEDQLVAMCMDMFMAGTETTSKSMSFCFSYLVRHQDVQLKAQEEIDRVVGRERAPTLEDRPNMPYVEAVVLESVRHFMGRTFAVPHRALKDTTILGYSIPEDTMVVSNFTTILMSETMYPEPLSFNPDRFLVDGKLTLPDYFFPFGLGKHRCMGDVLAKCNLFVFGSCMLQRFNFKPVEGELPSLSHVDGATPSAAPFKAIIEPRY